MSDDNTKVGVYSVLAGGSAKKFWPLRPYASVDSVMPPASVAPAAQGTGASNTLAAPPVFAIFDIVIIMSDDPVHQDTISDADSNDKLWQTISGSPPESSMPLILESDGKIHICFAIPPNKGNLTSNKTVAGFFEGTLHLEAKLDQPAAKTVNLELPLRAAKLTAEDNMFIFFVPHIVKVSAGWVQKPPKNYCWTKIRAVEAKPPAEGVPSEDFRLKVLRDNLPKGFESLNRRVELTTNSDGWLSCQIFSIFSLLSEGRPVLGLPIDWPLLFNSGEGYPSFSSLTHMPRGHMIRLKSANIKNNLQPFECDPIRMTKVSDVDLSSKSVMLDAGHGVVYALKDKRRSQEWFVAHLILDRIVSILTEEFNMPKNHIHRTRTAGFGLISPHEIKREDAPEQGVPRYTFDLVQQRIQAKQHAIGLRDISDLLLTRHDQSGVPQSVSDADRTRLLTINATTVNAVIHRINYAHHAQQQCVQMNADGSSSVRWDPTSGPKADGAYVFTLERIHPGPGQEPVVDDTAHFPIETTDWFNVDDDMMCVLAERSARWSLSKEIGSGPPADAATGRPKFADNAREIMKRHGAFDYMVEKILFYLGPVTALSAACAAGDQTIKLPISVDPGTTLTIDEGGDAEQVSVTGSGDGAPFVINLGSKLAHDHAANTRVKLSPPQAYLTNGTMAWNVVKFAGVESPRITFMNSLQNTCDLFITLHENALDPPVGVGAATLVANSPPPDGQIRKAKIYIKYVDGFDLGLRQGGIAKNDAHMLVSVNQVRDKWVYFELDFMDSPNLANGSQYRYQQMVESDFVDRVSRQIVSGIVEILVDPQPDLDTVKCNGQWTLW